MSLIRIALRMATVMALKGNTLAEDNVLDSEIGVLTEDLQGLKVKVKKGRFIAVYTDEAEAKPDELRMFHDNGLVNLCLEYGVTDTMIEEVEDPDDPAKKIRQVIPGIPHADRIHEFYLDLLGRQIRTNLSDSQSAAAEVLRGLISRVVNIKIERAGSQRERERVAAQKITFTVEALRDPQFTGDLPAGAPFLNFLAMLDAGGVDDQKLADLMRDQIPDAPGDIEASRERIGLTLDELNSLGLGYIPDADEDSEISTVTVEMTGAEPVEVSS